MKKYKALLTFLLSMSSLNCFGQEITISQNAVENIKSLQNKLTDLDRQKELKDIIVSTIKLASKLPKDDSQILLNSKYFIDAKLELQRITQKNYNTLIINEKTN